MHECIVRTERVKYVKIKENFFNNRPTIEDVVGNIELFIIIYSMQFYCLILCQHCSVFVTPLTDQPGLAVMRTGNGQVGNDNYSSSHSTTTPNTILKYGLTIFISMWPPPGLSSNHP